MSPIDVFRFYLNPNRTAPLVLWNILVVMKKYLSDFFGILKFKLPLWTD